jgi:hypothetical protein
VADLTLAGAQTSVLAGDKIQVSQDHESYAQQILKDDQCEWFIQVWTWKAVNSGPVLEIFRTACDLYMMGRIEGIIVISADDVGLREVPNVRHHGGITRYFDASANYTLALNRTLETVGLSPMNRARPIFITYRRDDSAGHAGRLRADLCQRYGEEQVFMDLAIEPGEDFVDAIRRAVESCAVLLAMIGRYWLTLTDVNTGMRRLDNPNDFVRLEIATAFQRNIRVIPVLVHRAQMPAENALPDDLKSLARRQAHEITDQRWDYDVGRLVSIIDKIVGFKG